MKLRLPRGGDLHVACGAGACATTEAADVETVVINGRIVMRNRRLLTLNETTIKSDARTFRDKIIKSLSTTSAQ